MSHLRSSKQVAVSSEKKSLLRVSNNFLANNTSLRDFVVHRWSLDESTGNVIDSVGWADGQVDANVVRSKDGKFGLGGLYFPGTNNSEGVNCGEVFFGNFSRDFTLSMYYKVNYEIVGDTSPYLSSQSNSSTSDGLSIILNNYTPDITVHVDGSSPILTAKGALIGFKNKWSHLALSYNTVDGYKLYINGVLMDSNSTTNSPNFAGLNFFIGNRENLDRPFSGYIDEVAIFRKTLNQEEILLLAKGLPYPYVSVPFISSLTLPNITPRFFNDLVYWADFSEDNAVLDNTSGGTPATNFEEIRQLLDKSVKIYHATQSSTSSSPLKIINSGNEVSSAFFNLDWMNVDQNSAGEMIKNVPYVYVFTVAKSDIINTLQTIFYISVGDSGNTRVAVYFDDQDRGYIGARRLSGDSFENLSSSNKHKGNFALVSGEFLFGEAKAVVRLNGQGEFVDSSFLTAGSVENTDSNSIQIGITNTGFAPFYGLIGEIVVYASNNKLSNDNIKKIEEYFINKWNIIDGLASLNDYEGITLWFDSSEITTLFADGAETQLVGHANQVYSFRSKELTVVDQTTVNNRPVRIDGGQAGKSVLVYDGNDALYTDNLSKFSNVGYIYVFAVVYKNTSNSAQGHVFNISTGDANDEARAAAAFLTDGTISIGGRRNDNDSFNGIVIDDEDFRDKFVLISAEFLFQSATVVGRINGIYETSGILHDIGNTQNTTSDRVSIGYSGASSSFNGFIAEMVFYTPSSPLSSGDVSAIEEHLMNKWKVGQEPDPINPETMIDEIAFWLDASDSSTLFNATTGGSLPGDGNAVARWGDKTGNGRHFIQGTGANQPTRETAVQNGLDIVKFYGGDYLVNNTYTVNGSEVTIIAVANRTAQSNVSDGGVTSPVIACGRGGSDTNLEFDLENYSGTDLLFMLPGPSISRKNNTGNRNTSGNPTGFMVASGISFTPVNITSGDDEIYIAALLNAVGSVSWTSKQEIGEIIVFTRALKLEELRGLERFLMDKWGIS